SEKIATKQPSSTPISKSADDIMAFRKELDALALKHLGPVHTTAPTSTNPVNTGSGNLNTGFEQVTPGNMEAISPSANHVEEVFSDADDDEMPEIRIYDKSSEGIFEQASYDDDGIITDFNNLPDEVDVSTNHTLRIHNAHPQSQILGDPNTPVQTRSSLKKITEAHALVSYIQAHQRSNHKDQQHCLFACFLSQFEPRKVSEALEDGSWVEAMQEELLQFKLQQVWVLVDLPNGAKVIGTKWVYRNKKDERGVVQEVMYQLFLAFASFMGFIVYQMDVKSAFLYGTIDEEVYVSQPPGFVDPDHPTKVYKVVKALYGLHQAPRAWYATLSTFLEKHGYKRGTIDKTLFIRRNKKDIMLVQFKQNKEGNLHLQDKYVAEILKKFDLVHVKAAITPMETKLPLTKDEEAFDVDVTPKTSHLNAVKRIFKYLKGKPNLGLWKSTTGGCQFLGQRLISWQCKKQTIVATSTTEAEYVAAANCCGQNPGLTILRTKHIGFRHHFIRDCYEKKLISVEKIHTDLNVADLLTKPFDGPRFNYLVVSIGFAEIVDFLRGSNLRYALTANPTIYDSLVKQFWQSAVASTREDGSLEISATVDTKRYIISEASIRDSLQLDDATGISMLPNDDLFEGMGQIGYPTDGTFTFWKSFFTPQWRYLVHHLLHCISSKSGGWDQFGSNIATALICLSTGQEHVLKLNPHTNTSVHHHLFHLQTPTPMPTSTSPPPTYSLSYTITYPLSTSPPPPIPSPTPPPIPTPTSPPPPPPETEPTTDEHIYEEQSPVHHHFSPSQAQATSHMPTDDLLQTVPKLISRIDSLELDLKQTKLTMGNAIVKLVKKVKKLEGFLKRRNLVLTDSEDEEPEAHASGEEQEEEISPNTLEAAKTLSKVASLKSRSIDKGRRYKRRKESTGKKVVSSLDFQEDNTGAEKINTAGEVNAASIEVNTASKVNTGSIELNTVIEQDSTAGENKGQREGKAPMLSEETPKKTKEQILQEEASLAEAIRLDSLQREEEAKQIHLDALLAQRIAEEEELTEQQKKRKAQVQFEAQHYTNEDWDLIRAKLEANAELSKSMLGSELQGEDFAKKMVDFVNQRKKFFAEERAKAKRNKPMTQSQLKTYMMNYLKNQGSWKLNQLRKLSFEEVKEEFDKLIKQIDSFAPISFEATKDSLKRFGEELQTKTPKRLKEDKDDEAKDDEPTKKLTKRRKQIARKGMHTSVDENVSDDSDKVDEQEETNTGTETPLNPVPVAMKTPKPLSTDSIWSEIEQQKIVSWRYYDTSRVHCLNLESMDVYLLSDRKYPLPAESEWLTGKETSNPFKIFNDSPLTGVNTPGSDENRLKLYDLMYIIVNVADMMDC
ncbi:putative ribonuclease H-like domain-containing protein, partial [Tanacetum coccineum]